MVRRAAAILCNIEHLFEKHFCPLVSIYIHNPQSIIYALLKMNEFDFFHVLKAKRVLV